MFIHYRFNRVRSGKSNFQSRHFIVVKKQGKPQPLHRIRISGLQSEFVCPNKPKVV